MHDIPAHIDTSTLNAEEREAYAKVHANDHLHGKSVGKGLVDLISWLLTVKLMARRGAGNIGKPKDHSPADGERGRGGGMIGNVLRSISRATGKEGSRDRA